MKKLWSFLGSNFDTLIAIILSIVAAIYGVFSGNQLPLLAGIATALGVVAFGLIRDRLNREVLAKQIAELKKSLPDQPSAMAFFHPMRDFDLHLKAATQIDLCGVSLTNTISTQFPILRERIGSGINLRVLVIDPKSHAIEMTSERSMNPKDTMYYQRRLESAFSDLTYLHKYAEDMKHTRNEGPKVGSISVRMLSYAPSFGLTSLNAAKKDGVIIVEIYPHKLGFKTPPTFVLTPEKDKDWYTYFIGQFEQMWKTANPWDPTPYIQTIPFDEIASS